MPCRRTGVVARAALGVDVPVNLFALRLRLLAHPLARLEELLRILRPQLVHLRARQDSPLLQLLLEGREAVDLLRDEVRARRRRVSVEPRDHHLEQERAPLGAHVVHGLPEPAITRLGVVAVDDRVLDAEHGSPVGDVLLGVLLGSGRRDAPLVVRDDHQAGQLAMRQRCPDEASGEVALGGPRVASLHDRDPLAPRALVGQGRPGRHRELHLDGRRHRSDVPAPHRVVVAEVSAGRIRVGGRVLHLPEGIHRIGAHREQRGGRPVVQMQVVELGALALVHEEPQRRVERLLAWAPHPEEPVPLLVHANQALLEAPREEHPVIECREKLRRKRAFVASRRCGRRGRGRGSRGHSRVSFSAMERGSKVVSSDRAVVQRVTRGSRVSAVRRGRMRKNSPSSTEREAQGRL